MNAQQIKSNLIELGCKEWKKGELHRVYLDGIDAKRLFNNEHAEFGKAHTAFFDVTAGEFKSSSKRVAMNLNCLMQD